LQVKSDEKPWEIVSERSVKALIEVPLPLFLCVVKKKQQRLRVYQTSPRFYVWTYPPYPARVKLIPGKPGNGVRTQWQDGEQFDLSAPILEFGVHEIEEAHFRERAKEILKYWSDVDEENLQLVKHGLRTFIMPERYATNELPPGGRVIQTRQTVSSEDLGHAVVCLRPPLDGVGFHMFRHDLFSAVRAMLLLRQLYWSDRHAPLALGSSRALNSLLGRVETGYEYEAIDALGSTLDLAILRSLGDRAGDHLRDVQRLYLTGKDVVDEDVRPLSSARNLKRLDLIDTSITDVGMGYLGALDALEELTIANADVTDEGLQSISGLGELRVLSLRDNKITDAGIVHLGNLAKLENLYVANTSVGVACPETLGKLPALEHIDVSGTLVTDEGLEHLRHAPRLRRLDYLRTKVTEAAYDAFLKTLPGWIEYMREAEEMVAFQEERAARWNSSSAPSS